MQGFEGAAHRIGRVLAMKFVAGTAPYRNTGFAVQRYAFSGPKGVVFGFTVSGLVERYRIVGRANHALEEPRLYGA